MPLAKIQFQPGIVTDTTNYTASGGWFNCDKVRFRMGMPEKIGGWVQVTSQTFQGTCRYIHQWSDYEDSEDYVGLGTSQKLYILWGQSYYDITPVKQTIDCAANPITALASSNLIWVAAPASIAQIGDNVIISGATAVGPYTAAQINQTLPVVGYYQGNQLQPEFQMPVTNTGAAVVGGGSAVVLNVQISPGLDDASQGEGWGIPPWSGWASTMGVPQNQGEGWGEPFDASSLSAVDTTVNQMRLWSLDNFGEDLVACIRGGPIYYWHENGGLSMPAANITQTVTVGGVTFTADPEAPTSAIQILVSPNDRHLVAYGCNDYGETVPNPLLVRWSDTENIYGGASGQTSGWQPLRTNTSGSQPLSAGSYIVCALRTVSGQILIWTDLGLWLQQYIGAPYQFGFQPIAQGLSIIGPNAMVNAAGNVYWMDHGVFEVYSGGVQELTCPVKDHIFANFNTTQGYKTYCGHNHSFHEVYWFYPSNNPANTNGENDSYVSYNYAEQSWAFGTIQRTAWLEKGPGDYPFATDRDNHLTYYHEYGCDANGAALPAFIDSADIDIDGGDHFLYMSRLIPDVFFRGAGGTQQSMGVTIYGRSEPLQFKRIWAELQINPMSTQQFVRIRDRQISFRFYSTGVGTGWRLGTIRSDMQPDGRR